MPTSTCAMPNSAKRVAKSMSWFLSTRSSGISIIIMSRLPENKKRKNRNLSQKFEAEAVVGRVFEVLLGAEIQLGGSYRSVPQQQLDLLQFASGLAAQLRAGAPQVVRFHTGVLAHDLQDSPGG